MLAFSIVPTNFSTTTAPSTTSSTPTPGTCTADGTRIWDAGGFWRRLRVGETCGSTGTQTIETRTTDQGGIVSPIQTGQESAFVTQPTTETGQESAFTPAPLPTVMPSPDQVWNPEPTPTPTSSSTPMELQPTTTLAPPPEPAFTEPAPTLPLFTEQGPAATVYEPAPASEPAPLPPLFTEQAPSAPVEPIPQEQPSAPAPTSASTPPEMQPHAGAQYTLAPSSTSSSSSSSSSTTTVNPNINVQVPSTIFQLPKLSPRAKTIIGIGAGLIAGLAIYRALRG